MLTIIKDIKGPERFPKILAILFTADLFYIVLHVLSKIARFFDFGTTLRKETFSLTMDLGLSESFQYVKEFWIVLFFVWLIVKNKEGAFAGWALLYTYLLLDDMFSFHEQISKFVLDGLHIKPEQILFTNVRYQDFGEIGVSFFFGLLFLTLIGVAYLKGNAQIRTTFHSLIACLLLLVAFGVVADFADRLFSEQAHKILLELSDIVEDGGEMIVMSITCWYVYSLTERAPRVTAPLTS